MTTEETLTEEETTFVKMASNDESSDVRGGQFGQSVDAEQLTSMSHEESSRFVIKSVIDPRTSAEISMDQVSLSLAHLLPKFNGISLQKDTSLIKCSLRSNEFFKR